MFFFHAAYAARESRALFELLNEARRGFRSYKENTMVSAVRNGAFQMCLHAEGGRITCPYHFKRVKMMTGKA